jgi:type II secretory ATPase GspE/PulE/Tfp pilus assembly ATPase PilB-like protein
VIPGPVKIQVVADEAMDEKYRITFGSVIRTALRHKPDDLVVGETRDHETAQAAVGASHTGHLTFSTLHTTNIQTSIKRMIDLGIDAVNLSDVLTLVVSQTLLPMLCPHCRVDYQGSGAERSQKGCPHCNNRGIVGKVVVYEMCYFDEEARRAVVEYKMQEQFTRLELSGLYIKIEDVLRQLVSEGKIDRRYLEDMA